MDSTLLFLLFSGFLALDCCRAAHADTLNPGLIPLGESEAFLGNTGTGEAHDTGAAYFNPAGLAYVDRDEVSVSGSVYMSFSTQSSAIAILDSTPIPYSASGFNTIPSTYAVTLKEGDWHLALSVLVPDSITLDNQSTFQTPNTNGTIMQSTRYSELWIGGTLARKIDSRWSVGATLFAIQRSESDLVGVVLNVPGSANTSASSLTLTDLSSIGLALSIGVDYKASDWLNLGLRVQSPSIQVSGSASTYESSSSVVNGVLTSGNINSPSIPAQYLLPLDMTFGSAFHLGDFATLFWDVSLQLGESYDSIPGSALSTQMITDPTFRTNFGAEIRAARDFPVRVGLFYNPSTLHNLGSEAPGGNEQTNYWGITGGVSKVSEHVETGLGGFYILGSGQASPTDGNPGQYYSASANVYGALLMTSYLF